MASGHWGGFGLLITEFLCVSEEGLAYPMQAAIYDDEFIPSFSRLTGRVHENGGRIFAQLQHSGRMQGKEVQIKWQWEPAISRIKPI